jgi:hypothetical protein
MVQVVEYLPAKPEALSSNPLPPKSKLLLKVEKTQQMGENFCKSYI